MTVSMLNLNAILLNILLVQAMAPLLKIRRVLKDPVMLKAFKLANYAWLAHSSDK